MAGRVWRNRVAKSVTVVGLLSVVLSGPAAVAGELTVLSAGAVEPGLKAVAAAFEKQTGHVVKISFNTVPQIRTRIEGGERVDVVIATPAVLDELAKVGKVEDARVPLGRVGMGVAVRPGASVPDIVNGEAIKRSVLAADGLVFSRGSSGVYFESLLKKMGIYEQIQGKITRYDDGASVFEHVLRGKANEVGVGQITEIRLYRGKGLRLVGPLPADVQNHTAYVAASTPAASNPGITRDFVRFLGSPAAKALFATAGIEQ